MKALVVDDDIVSRMALMDLLSTYGLFELEEADDGEAAWMLLEGGMRPVICFCDVRMPRMSGIDLLERIKKHPNLKDMPFVLVSSASDRDTVLQAVKLGAVGYILKPLQPADARAHLDKIFKVTLEKLVENPAATLKRLNIGPDRLSAYLSAFHTQITAAAGDMDTMLSAGATSDALVRLDAILTGCKTLGLWKVATDLEAARAGVLETARINDILHDILVTVERQADRIKASTGVAA